MSAKGKAEASQSPKKRETLKASFSRRMVVHERCANKACGAFVSVFFFSACCISFFSLVFVFLDIGMNQF